MNVVFFIIDALRADHLGYMGYTGGTSPFLDSLSKESMVFMNCYANNNSTEPSSTTIVTGLYPETHQIVSTEGELWLSKEIPMLNEILHERNYRTVSIYPGGKWFKERFDIYVPEPHFYPLDDNLINLMHSIRHQDFFIYMHVMTCHVPYSANRNIPHVHSSLAVEPPLAERKKRSFGELPEPIKTMFQKEPMRKIIGYYDDAIYYTDRILDKIVSWIDRNLPDTILVVTADHGESFWEHGIYLEHSCGLYEQQLHVPLLIRSPQIAHREIRGLVEHVDIVPTVLDLLNIPVYDPILGIEHLALDGESLLVTKGKHEIHACENTWQSKRMIRRGNWKVILKVGRDFQQLGVDKEIYDLWGDPGETINLLGQGIPEIQSLDMIRSMEEWLTFAPKDPLKEQECSLPKLHPEALSPEVKEKLKEQGFL